MVNHKRVVKNKCNLEQDVRQKLTENEIGLVGPPPMSND
jgi:hypothetical protein